MAYSRLVRLEKYLVETGSAVSNRVSAAMIRSGRVQVSGDVCIDGKFKIDPWKQSVSVDGFAVTQEVPLLCQYHKPIGTHCTLHDSLGRSDLRDVIPLGWRRDMQPVSRLQANVSGLVLFCASVQLTRILRQDLEETYVAHCEYSSSRLSHERLIDNIKTASAHKKSHGLQEIALIDDLTTKREHSFIRLRLVVSSNGGGEHYLNKARSLLASLGTPIARLHRIQCGPALLGNLPIGDFQPVLTHGALAWATSRLLDHENHRQTPPHSISSASSAGSRDLIRRC